MPKGHTAWVLVLAALAAAAARPSTDRARAPVTATATAPASQAVDYYSRTAEEFFKLPQVGQRLGKNAADISLLEAAVFHDTNRERVAAKLPALQHSFAMALMARRHSAEMGELQFFDHTSPTPAHRTLTDRLFNVGLVNVTAGENIAVLPAKEIGSGHYITHDPLNGNEVWYDEVTGKRIDYYTYKELAETVVTQWKNSPPHWKNIIDPQFKYLGVGSARGPYDDKKQDSFYFTQNFCATSQPGAEAKAKADPLLQSK
jgi:uncharacterized protein YkwD